MGQISALCSCRIKSRLQEVCNLGQISAFCGCRIKSRLQEVFATWGNLISALCSCRIKSRLPRGLYNLRQISALCSRRIKSRLQEVFATWGKGAPCERPASFAAAALGFRQRPPVTAGSPTPSALSPRRAGKGPATAATASSAARHGRCSRTDKACDGEDEGAGARV